MNAKITCETLRPTLETMLHGDIATLAPDQVERLEAHLNECGACAAMLTAEAVQPEPIFAARGGDVPGDAAWERVWRNIDAVADTTAAGADTSATQADRKAAGTRAVSTGAVAIRRFRPAWSWSALAAAAALVLMVGWWRLGIGPGSGDSPLILAGADDVRIDALEVFGDATAMVMTVGENDDIPVIWVVDDEGA